MLFEVILFVFRVTASIFLLVFRFVSVVFGFVFIVGFREVVSRFFRYVGIVLVVRIDLGFAVF